MSTTTNLHTIWFDLADEVATLAATDDPRLGDVVLGIEELVGCRLGDAERTPVVLARRFARAMRHGLATGIEPDLTDLAAQPV
jgi:hypothetical protein